MSNTEFLEQFAFGGLLAVCIGRPDTPTFYQSIPQDLPSDIDVYFAPAMRKLEGMEKKDVLGTRALWVDADDPQNPQYTLPPSARVFSGHGWHLYWFLDEPNHTVSLIEGYNKMLAEDVPTGDIGCWNINRVLRVPGTVNTKGQPVAVTLKNLLPGITYKIEDFEVLRSLPDKTRHKIRTGDQRGYRSRSERDWAILTDLIIGGASDDLIRTIFTHQPCGDKSRESNLNYLPRSIEKIRAKIKNTDPKSGIIEQADGYYIPNKKGTTRISTFTMTPKILLDGSAHKAEDALVVDVVASSYIWKDVTFTRSAFTSVRKMDRECPLAAWQFLGRDDHIRRLLPYLLEKLQKEGLPKVSASPMLGLHKSRDTWYFVGDKQTIGAKEVWDGYTGPLAWLPSMKEHPELELHTRLSDDDLQLVAKSVPLLNDDKTIWPMIGWYAAAMLKPWLEEQNYRFPILTVTGTKGSGKTTLIQRVFMPLFGQTDPKSYDAGTTRFVTLALMGSSNAVPIAFSEFRYESVEKFIRYILLSYDTGHDPRGRGDQTTVDYPLAAPYSVDGEDLVDDPAARERIIVAQLHPGAVREGSEAYETFNDFRTRIPEGFGGYYIQQVLQALPTLRSLLDECREAIFKAFPGRLPDRVRANHIVAYFGIRLFCQVCGITDIPSPEVLDESISSVFDLESGRARTMVDSMIEDLVNAAYQGTQSFRYKYVPAEGVFYFQLASAHSWWLGSRRRQGRGALERDALRTQLQEAEYFDGKGTIDHTWMYGVKLAQAQELGLDVPTQLKTNTFTVKGVSS